MREAPNADAASTGRRRHVAHAGGHQPDHDRDRVQHRGDHARDPRHRHQVDERDDVDELRQRLERVEQRAQQLLHARALGGPDARSRCRSPRRARWPPAPARPCPSPAQTPMTPIAASISSTVIAGRRPLSTNAIAVRPPSTTNQGVSISTTRSGSSKYSSRKFPIGSVIPKMNEVRVLDVVEPVLDPAQQRVVDRGRVDGGGGLELVRVDRRRRPARGATSTITTMPPKVASVIDARARLRALVGEVAAGRGRCARRSPPSRGRARSP